MGDGPVDPPQAAPKHETATVSVDRRRPITRARSLEPLRVRAAIILRLNQPPSGVPLSTPPSEGGSAQPGPAPGWHWFPSDTNPTVSHSSSPVQRAGRKVGASGTGGWSVASPRDPKPERACLVREFNIEVYPNSPVDKRATALSFPIYRRVNVGSRRAEPYGGGGARMSASALRGSGVTDERTSHIASRGGSPGHSRSVLSQSGLSTTKMLRGFRITTGTRYCIEHEDGNEGPLVRAVCCGPRDG
jgi:hypothetical protein